MYLSIGYKLLKTHVKCTPRSRKKRPAISFQKLNHNMNKDVERDEPQSLIVLVTIPYHGHMNPALQLATLLKSKGFSITISYIQVDNPRAPFPSLDHSGDFTFTPLPCDLSHLSNPDDFLAQARAMNESLEAPLLDLLTRMKKDEEKQVSCVVYDALLFRAEEVAQALQVPSIRLHTNSCMTLVTLCHSSRLATDLYGSSKPDELVCGFEPLRFKDLFIHNLDNLDSWLDLIASACTMRSSSAIIINTTECLEQQQIERLRQEHPQVLLFPVGPMHRLSLARPVSNGDTSCMSWLDKQPHDSVIYVSLGSVIWLDMSEFVELAEALANSERRFLWVVRPRSVGGCDWLEALPKDFYDRVDEDRGMIVKWAPQRDVLSHDAVGGFLSHGGWNSTLESMSAGVPMLCKPCFGDQRSNARWVSQVWRTGLEIERLKRNEIEAAIRKLMAEEEGEEMKVRTRDLKDRIEASVSEGGSSCKSLNELAHFIQSL